jgi:hypothetical protein
MTAPTLEGPLQNPERRDIAIEITHDSVTFPQLETQPLDEARSPRNDGDTGNEQPNAENTFREEKGDGSIEKGDNEEEQEGGYEQQESNVPSIENTVTRLSIQFPTSDSNTTTWN